MLPPPKVFSMPVVRCPSCSHGIDPHGLNPGSDCGMGDENGMRCKCLWSPNDIAAQVAHDERHAALIEAGRAVQALTVKARMGESSWVRIDHVTDLLNRRANA